MKLLSTIVLLALALTAPAAGAQSYRVEGDLEFTLTGIQILQTPFSGIFDVDLAAVDIDTDPTVGLFELSAVDIDFGGAFQANSGTLTQTSFSGSGDTRQAISALAAADQFFDDSTISLDIVLRNAPSDPNLPLLLDLNRVDFVSSTLTTPDFSLSSNASNFQITAIPEPSGGITIAILAITCCGYRFRAI